MKRSILFALFVCFALASSAQNALFLVGKWHVVKLVSGDGFTYRAENRQKLFDKAMAEARSESIYRTGGFTSKDSAEAATKHTYLLKVMFDAVHTYHANGNYTLNTWKDEEGWKPFLSKGKYTYDAATTKLLVSTPEKQLNYWVDKVPEGIRITINSRMYMILSRVQ